MAEPRDVIARALTRSVNQRGVTVTDLISRTHGRLHVAPESADDILAALADAGYEVVPRTDTPPDIEPEYVGETLRIACACGEPDCGNPTLVIGDEAVGDATFAIHYGSGETFEWMGSVASTEDLLTIRKWIDWYLWRERDLAAIEQTEEGGQR